ncbi:MAG: hypothetical protein ACREE0_00430 [Phenylobacterium sp.]
MKIAILTAVAALALCAGAAGAQNFEGTTSILCLDVSGKSLPATCQSQASRLEKREDICTCPMGGDRVITPICPEGVKPPAESAAYEKARHAAVTKGSLVGQTYEGKPMCIIGRNRQGY